MPGFFALSRWAEVDNLGSGGSGSQVGIPAPAGRRDVGFSGLRRKIRRSLKAVEMESLEGKRPPPYVEICRISRIIRFLRLSKRSFSSLIHFPMRWHRDMHPITNPAKPPGCPRCSDTAPASTGPVTVSVSSKRRKEHHPRVSCTIRGWEQEGRTGGGC